MIIFSIVLIVIANKQVLVKDTTSDNLPPVLKELAENKNFRNQILNSNSDEIQAISDYAGQILLKKGLKSQVKICEVEASCGIDYPSNSNVIEIYSAERIISGENNAGVWTFKKIKLFAWR